MKLKDALFVPFTFVDVQVTEEVRVGRKEKEYETPRLLIRVPRGKPVHWTTGEPATEPGFEVQNVTEAERPEIVAKDVIGAMSNGVRSMFSILT